MRILVVEDEIKPYLAFSDVDPTLQSIRINRLKQSVPQFRAPPATPVAA
jgi:predicted metalloprotease